MKTISPLKVVLLITTKLNQFLLILFLSILFLNFSSAQDLSQNAQRQLKSLMDEKESRTLDQQKINSQIWYSYIMDGGKKITPEVPTLRTGIRKDADGMIKTNITAEVSPQLLKELEQYGCRILQSYVEHNLIVAMIPLESVEDIARTETIRYINLWVSPVLNSNHAENLNMNRCLSVSETDNIEAIKGINNSKSKVASILERMEKVTSSMAIGSVTSEGDVSHQSDLVRSDFNVTGAGIKIGVLSDSYDYLGVASADVLAGELPGVGNPFGNTVPVTVLSEISGASGTDEGRAMLQIIHDVAPGAQLYFASGYNGEVDFAQRVLELYAAGCDIIVDDVTFLSETAFGVGPITQSIDIITANGALYFSSAGNSGNLNDGTSGTWEGDFQDGGTLALFPGGTLHDFGGGQLFNTITQVGVVNTLTWSDPFNASTNDYEMFITDSNGTNILGMSSDYSPFAFQQIINANVGERIYILKDLAAQTRALRLATNRGRLTLGTQGETFGHNAAANTITVAAVSAAVTHPGIFSASNVVENFSSDGPRRKFYDTNGSEITPGNVLFGTNGGIVLQKPDITAADAVTTSMVGFAPFNGTSAAAPHAAAIAALMKEALPNYTYSQVRDLLYSTAVDIEDPGVDRDAGRGIIMPHAALSSLGFDLYDANIAETGSTYNNANGVMEPGELGYFNFELRNDPTVGPFTNVKMVLNSSTDGVTIIDGEINATSINGSYINQFTFVTSHNVDCGAELDFTITITYDGGVLSPQTLSDNFRLGVAIPSISGTLGSPPQTGASFTSTSGLFFGHLGKADSSIGTGCYVIPNTDCDTPLPIYCRREIDILYQYHAYQFSNQDLVETQCITVNVPWINIPTIPDQQGLHIVAYNNAGLNVFQAEDNIIGSYKNIQPPSTPPGSFSFEVPPGENYTIVIQGSGWRNGSDGTGLQYAFDIEQLQCDNVPCISNDPVVIAPEPLANNAVQFTGTVGIPFSQTFSTSGGSGYADYFSGPANIPPGLTLQRNYNSTATLSGIPTSTYGSELYVLLGYDALGCAPPDLNNYNIQIAPCTPVNILNAVSSNAPICSSETLNLSVTPSGQAPYTYQWSGPGGTFTNGDTANPSVSNPVSGTYSVTVTNYCGSVVSSTSVNINTPPVVNIAGPYNLDTDPGLCTGTTSPSQLFALASATGVPTPQISIGFNPSYPVGMSTATVDAVNVCGTDQGTIDIIVTDINSPIAVCKDLKVEVSDGQSYILAEDIDGGSSDACGGSLDQYLVNGSVGGNSIETQIEGLQLVTLTVIDFSGNQESCEAEVTVVKDLCSVGDDGIDSDGGGLPDACDCSPYDSFNDNIILQNGKNAGMDFDGLDDFITIPNNPALIPTNSNSMTFEAWINPDEIVGYQPIVSSASVGAVSYYNFEINLQNDKLNVRTISSTSVLSNASIPVDTWTHVVVAFTAHPTTSSLSTIEIYINGILDNSVTGSFANANWGYPIILGNINGQNLPYNGSLEEVRFWSSARSIDEIQLLKDRELSGMESGLAAYYNFNEGVPEGDNTGRTTVEDYSSNDLDASLSGFTQNGATSNWINAIENLNLDVFLRDSLAPCINCPEILDVCMDFDGVNDYITIPNQPELIPTTSNAVTMEAWIYPEISSNENGHISSSGDFPNRNHQIYLINNTNKLVIDGLTANPMISNSDIPHNEWTHIAVTFNLNETKLYINGVLDNTRIGNLTANNLGFDLTFGSQESGTPSTWNWDGKMDEIRIWDDVRSASEILDNMNMELKGDETGLLAYYNLSQGIPDVDNSSLTVVEDISSYNRDGIVIGFAKTGTSSNWVSGSPFLASPQTNAALYFDGVDDHLTIANQYNLIATNTQAMTFEAWIYPEKATGISMIYSTGIFPDVKNQIFLSDDKINITGFGLPAMVSTSSIPSFKWSHIAVVFDMTETRLYVNGELDNTRIGTLTSDNVGFDIGLGSQENGMPSSWNFLGKMDDVRMWQVARSESQIFDNMLTEQTGLEAELAAYFNFNNGIPEGDNSAVVSVPDITGNGGGALLNGFSKMGATSNWVSSPHRFFDFDADGTPDYCDNCIAPKDLILQNINLEGIFRATETITLGDNLNFPSSGIINLRAPTVIVPQSIEVPVDVILNIDPEGCQE